MLELGLDRETIEIYRENADFHTSVSIKSAVVSYIHYRLWPILGRIRLDLYSTEMEGLSWLCSEIASLFEISMAKRIIIFETSPELIALAPG